MRVSTKRRELSRARIIAKLTLIESYVQFGVPDGAFVPRSINQFRRWEDATLALESIGSPNTMSPTSSPHNADLIHRVVDALKKLERAAGLGSEPKSRPARRATWRKLAIARKKQLKALEIAAGKIAESWHIIHDELVTKNKEIANLEEKRSHYIAEIKRLRDQLSNPQPRELRSVRARES